MEHWELGGRVPQLPGNVEGKITLIAVVAWCCNDTATWSTAKSGKLLKALPITDAMKTSALDLHSGFKNYDGGVIIGPGSAKIWGLESSSETGAEKSRAS